MYIYRDNDFLKITMTEEEFDSSPLPGKGWVKSLPLADRQNIMWQKIKDQRDLLTQSGGYKVGTKWFHSDIMSRTQQIGLTILGANIPAGLMWKTMDGSFIPMTPTLAQQVFITAAQSDTTIFASAEQHKAAMLTLQNPEEYDYTKGWPTTYLG